MNLGTNIQRVVFVSRPNRITVIAVKNNRRIKCFLANPGRLSELLKVHTELVINQIPISSKRKTLYDVVAVRHGELWISLDTRIPNKLVNYALSEKRLKEFQTHTTITREVTFHRSRFDFLLESQMQSCLLEVKSCTLVRNHVAIFPDAPTTRGTKHLEDLALAKRLGYRACIMFVIQRADATSFRPNHKTDPDFCEALQKARQTGVEVYARRCRFNFDNFDLQLDVRIPVMT